MEDKVSQGIDVNFEMLFRAMPGLLLILSPELNILDANAGYLKAVHKTHDELIGRNLFHVFPSNTSYSQNGKDNLKLSLQRVIDQKTSDTIPVSRYDLGHAAGSNSQQAKDYWSVVNSPVLDDKGVLLYIIHEVRNITALVQEEEHVKTSHDSLRLMAKIVGGAVWEYDIPNKKFNWSESYKQLFGYSDEDLQVKPDDWSFRVHPDDITATRKAIDTVIGVKGKSWTGEYRYKKADGTYADVLDHGYILYDLSGNPVRMLGSMIDLSKQKEFERELQISNERFEYVAKATNDVIWDWDLLKNTIWWNDGFETLFGHSNLSQNTSTESWFQNIHPSDLHQIESSIQKAINSGDESWEATYRFMCSDGTYKIVQDKGYIVHDEEDQAIRMIGAMVDITENIEIERKLQESNNRTRQVLESLPLMTWTADPNGESIRFSQSWNNYTGCTEEELQAWWLNGLIHPDDAEETLKLWQLSVKTGEPFEIENRWRSKDGSYRWFLARSVPIRNSVGSITMWVGSNTDIEDHKQLLLSVQESTKRTKFLAETIPQIVWSSDPEGRAAYFNQRWYQFTQLKPEESLEWGWGNCIHPNDVPRVTEAWNRSMGTGEKFEMELRMLDGQTKEYRWFLSRSLPMRNDEGEVINWFGTATDIHDVKLLNQRLKESNKQFRFLAESIPQMVWTTDTKGYHNYFNQRWLHYTRLTLEQSQGLIWNDILHPDDRDRAWVRWQQSLLTGEYYEIEYRIKNGADGTYRWFLAQAMPMRNKAGDILKWFGTCTDIEDHKRAEEELVDKNLELERINQDLDSFVYTASHDLKLPVINMAGIFNELMNTAEFRDPEAPAMIQMFNKSLRQLHETIHDLSEVVRIQKEHERELEHINLYELTQDVMISMQDLVKETGARIHTNFDDASTIPFTRSSLKSIFYNLINNAIKYRDANRAPEILITSSQKGSFVELRIQDNGIGIDMSKHQNKLFQMFKRFHNHVAGSGLGLYIVNRLLNNHGGYINLESTLNEGTTFYLYFKTVTSK